MTSPHSDLVNGVRNSHHSESEESEVFDLRARSDLRLFHSQHVQLEPDSASASDTENITGPTVEVVACDAVRPAAVEGSEMPVDPQTTPAKNELPSLIESPGTHSTPNSTSVRTPTTVLQVASGSNATFGPMLIPNPLFDSVADSEIENSAHLLIGA